MQYTVHTYVLKQQYSLRYQHQKVGMQFVSITIDMLQIPEKLLLLHRILSSCAKRICVARCLKLSLLLLKTDLNQKTGRISLYKMRLMQGQHLVSTTLARSIRTLTVLLLQLMSTHGGRNSSAENEINI